MEYSTKRKQNTTIFRISGEIDHHTSKLLREKADQILLAAGGRNLIFDLQEVGFMDSSGIGMMIGRYKQAESLGGRIAILHANEKVQEIIALSGLSALLPTFASLEDALDYTEGRDRNAG